MNTEIIAQPNPWPELYPASFFRPFEAEYVCELLNWLGPLTDAEVQFDIPNDPEYDDDPDWQMDCQDARDVQSLLDLVGCLDASL